jgi:3'-phosphoadenosine 5'-phosphosulfate (PAPS) 3'-phosphatase
VTPQPSTLVSSPWHSRLATAIAAVRSAGAALLALRGDVVGARVDGDQLKTAADVASEGWVVAMLANTFAGELILAEEAFDRAAIPWPGARDYWTVDALDGTRSFVDGYDGFCVQVAYVADGIPRIGAIAEPVTGAVYAAAEGAGAWRIANEPSRLEVADATSLHRGLRYVDSTRPSGAVGDLVQRYAAVLVECGSVGLKICRVAEGRGDVYAKRFRYKLWDVAPGEVLLREAGGTLTDWAGAPIDYAGTRVVHDTLLVAPRSLAAACIAALAER